MNPDKIWTLYIRIPLSAPEKECMIGTWADALEAANKIMDQRDDAWAVEIKELWQAGPGQIIYKAERE